ncbi:MAG: ATP-binding protein [Candidatus Thorarchaeota archaeon]|nr:ATP-binding protein [Candidatus Thorarchaeota archaeon]
MDENNPPPHDDLGASSGGDSSLGELIPKQLLSFHPLVTEPLDLLVDAEVGVVLGRSESLHRKYGKIGLGMLGAVCESSDDPLLSLLGMPVHLDLISPHVTLVAGKRGSGKSYTLGIVGEELARAMARQEIEVAVVIIDAVDVFRQMVEPNEEQRDLLSKWGLEASGFNASVYIPRRTYEGLPEEVRQKSRLCPLTISPAELSTSDWGYVLEKEGQLSTAIDNLISDVIESLRKGYVLEDGEVVSPRPDFSITDMINCIETNSRIEELYKPATKMALIQRLKRAQRLGVFLPRGTSAQDLAVPGKVTIIDVAPLGSDAEAVLAILTSILCRQVLTYRMAWTEEGTSAREQLPPTWLIIDEAHILVPRSGTTPAKGAIIGYAKLGRRFGCSLVLCTQQPSAVADEAISQADIVLSHALSLDADIKALQQRAPAVMPSLFKEKAFISGLPKGVAVVFDQVTENKRGFLMQVRPRISKHGGTDRLSALFEAASIVGQEPSVTPEGVQEAEFVEAEVTHADDDVSYSLPAVSPPPLRLSRTDWERLDEHIRDYIAAMLDRRMQELLLTDEPSPVREVSASMVAAPPDTRETSAPTPQAEESIPFDASRVLVKKFGPLTRSLLERSLTRTLLYARTPHEYLFPMGTIHRVNWSIMSESVSAATLVAAVIARLQSAGMSVVSVREDSGVTFVFLSKNVTKAALMVGESQGLVCVPVVIAGPDARPVNAVADKLRTLT